MIILNLFILIIFSSVINKLDNIKNKYNNLVRIGIITLLYSIYLLKDLSLDLIVNSSIKDIYIFNDLYKLNIFNIYIILLLLVIIISLLSISTTSLRDKYSNIFKIGDNLIELNIFYITIILFNVVGLILLLTSNNLISIFISIELQSYSLYILTGIIPKSETSGHNSLFYYLIGGLGSIVLLYGISLLFYMTSNIYLNHINILQLTNSDLFFNCSFGWLLIILGLLIKIGAAPMYNWSILLYSNSNTIITSYISIIPKISILSYILLLILNNSPIQPLFDINNDYYNYSIIFTLSIIITLSLIIGSIGGLTQIKIKSILAYSGLLNIGYMLFIIMSTSNYYVNSIIAFIIYLTQYSFNHIAIFLLLIIAVIYRENNTNTIAAATEPDLSKDQAEQQQPINNNSRLTAYKNLIYVYELINIKSNRYLIFSLIIIIGSFIGIPPLFGFYGKYYLFVSVINNNYILLSLLLIISSIISSIYYLYFLNITLFDSPSDKNTINGSTNNGIKSLNGNYITYLLSSYILIILFNFIQWKNILKGTYLISLLLL